MVGHRRLSKRSREEYEHPYLCIYLEICPSVTCGLLPILAANPSWGSGHRSFFTKPGAWSGLPTSRCHAVPMQPPSPCCRRELRKWPCFMTTTNKFTERGELRALATHILASATADVALTSTPPVYLCLPCWSNDKNWEHSDSPIKMHSPESRTPAAEELQPEKVEGNERQLYPGHSLLYFSYQIFIYCVLSMTLRLKKHAWS